MNHESDPASEAVMDFQHRVVRQVSPHNRHSDEGRENYAAEPDYRCNEVYASDAKFYDCAHFSFDAGVRESTIRNKWLAKIRSSAASSAATETFRWLCGFL